MKNDVCLSTGPDDLSMQWTLSSDQSTATFSFYDGDECETPTGESFTHKTNECFNDPELIGVNYGFYDTSVE